MFKLGTYEYYEDVNFGLLNLRGSGQKILDVGCGNGLMGELYKKTGNEYYGIELSTDIKNKALKRLDKFFNADLTDFGRIQKLIGKDKFDVIIFADVLEHLVDPVSALKFYKKFLNKNGKVYISVPNVAVWYVRMWLLFGKFNYGPCGLLDRTHLRFFTKNNVNLLAEEAGMEIEKIDITPGIARYFQYIFRDFVKKGKDNRRYWVDSSIFKFYARFVYKIEYYSCRIWPNLLAYQFIATLKDKIEK